MKNFYKIDNLFERELNQEVRLESFINLKSLKQAWFALVFLSTAYSVYAMANFNYRTDKLMSQYGEYKKSVFVQREVPTEDLATSNSHNPITLSQF